MSSEVILMMHPTFGVLGTLAAMWVLADGLQVSEANLARIRAVSLGVAVLMWLSYLVGGYWYVADYPADKAVILAGPWPLAHRVVMEVKEHLFFNLLLLSSYLPLVAWGSPLLTRSGARHLLVVLAGLIVLLGLAMEGAGAIVAMGVKLGLRAGGAS